MKEPQKRLTRWERFLATEIGIEFKACLYFLSIMFFYCTYRIANGSLFGNIIHMAEMIFLTYAIGYVQVYFLSNFDESEHLHGKELLYIFVCSVFYAVISYLGGWFHRNIPVTIGFAFYMMFAYFVASWLYRFKRNTDARLLNEDLKSFQDRRNRSLIDENK